MAGGRKRTKSSARSPATDKPLDSGNKRRKTSTKTVAPDNLKASGNKRGKSSAKSAAPDKPGVSGNKRRKTSAKSALRAQPGVSGNQAINRPALAQHDSTVLDLAFAMDCTGSMASYIATARENIRNIVEQLVASEKSDIHLALVEYRDHPPEERTFVTRTHDFTPSVSTMRKWLDDCQARGGGDLPEAVADALHDVVRLRWRTNSTKICVLISDAPPHGIGVITYDRFPNGVPSGIDPMEAVREMAENGITLYSVGCEPAITPYKEFFCAIAYLTGGQYVPLTAAKLLTQVIIGGAQEEMSLEKFMAEVDEEVEREMKSGQKINKAAVTKRVHAKLKSKGAMTKHLYLNKRELSGASSATKKLSKCKSMKDIRKKFTPKKPSGPIFASISTSFSSMLGRGIKRKAVDPVATSSSVKRRRAVSKKKGAKSRAVSKSAAKKGARSRSVKTGAKVRASAMKKATADSYETVEAEPRMVQVERMVQKVLMRKEGKKKGGMGLKKGGK